MYGRHIMIPKAVQAILMELNAAGFEAYAVGGCVRDSLRGEIPQDWDICTNALPEQTQNCFEKDRTILTGVRYGTVTVLREQAAYEITTYRAELGYTDCRHPAEVRFLDELRGDLMRRDFTVNAMAADAEGSVIDLFGGEEDLHNGVIRCVGEARARFSEDALRILRGLRFAARFGFSFAPETAEAIHALRENLSFIAPERLQKELNGLLAGVAAPQVLREFADVLCVLIPELRDCIGFCQYNHHHLLDVWSHTLAALEAAEPDVQLRLAVLLHDVGKPPVFTMDKQLVGHFYGHGVVSGALTEQILRRLRYDLETVRTVTTLVREHDCMLQPLTEKRVRRLLSRLGEPVLRKLLRLQRADRLGGRTEAPGQVEDSVREAETLLEEVLARDDCVTLHQLALKGNDLMKMGVPQGKTIGAILNKLLDAVLDGSLPNERTALEEVAESLVKTDNFLGH